MPAGKARVNHNQRKQAVSSPGNVTTDHPTTPRRATNQARVANPDQQDRQRTHYQQTHYRGGISRGEAAGKAYRRRTQNDLATLGFQGAAIKQRDWRRKQSLLRTVVQARARQIAGEDLRVKPGEDRRGYLEKKMMGLGDAFGVKNALKSKVFQTIGQAGDIGLQIGPGVYQLAKAETQDVSDTTKGHPTVKRTAPIAKAMVTQPKEDIKHPTANIPRTALDVLAVASAGAGIGARGAAGLSAADEAAQAGARAGIIKAALTRPTSEGGSLLRRPPPGVASAFAKYQGPMGENSVVAPEGHYFAPHPTKEGVHILKQLPEGARKGDYTIRAAKGAAWRVGKVDKKGNQLYTLQETPDVGEYVPPKEGKAGGGAPGKRYRYTESGNIKESGGYSNELVPGQIKAKAGYKFIPTGKQGQFKLVKEVNMIPGRTELPALPDNTYLKSGKSQVTYTAKSTAAREFMFPRADNPLFRPLTNIKAKMVQDYLDDPNKPRGYQTQAFIAKNLASDLVRRGHYNQSVTGVKYTKAQFLKDAQEHGLIGENSLAAKMFQHRIVEESSKHHFFGLMRQVNRPFRFFGVYLRPAYFFTNYPGNIAMGAMTKGFKIVGGFKRAGAGGRMSKVHLGEDAVHQLDHDVQTGRILSQQIGQPTGTPFLGSHRAGQVEQEVTRAVSHITDRQFRHSAWYIRAAERGFKTDEQQRALLLDPKFSRDREIVRRLANKDAVDFNSLHPWERDLVDIVYFYPWMSRATVWTGRTAANNPIKTAVLGQLATQAQAKERQQLGPFPGWMKGYAQAGKGHVINMAPLSTWSTPGQVLQYAAGGRAGRRAIAEEFGTPALQFTSTAPGDWMRNIIQSTGAVGLALGHPSKTFPNNPLWQRGARFAFGSPYIPRSYNQKQVLSQAKKEVSPVEKQHISDQQERGKMVAEARKVGLMQGYTLPPELRAAYNRKNDRYLNRAKRAEDLGVNKLSGKDMFLADIDLLYKVHVWPKSEHDAAKAWAEKQYASDKKYKFGPALSYLNRSFNYSSTISKYRKGIVDAGGHLD